MDTSKILQIVIELFCEITGGKNLRHPFGNNYSVTILCSLVKRPLYKPLLLLLLTVDVNVSLCPLGGAGHGTVSLQELQDRL